MAKGRGRVTSRESVAVREKTTIIDTTREQREGCTIVTGGTEELSLVNYRGHRICLWCQTQWQKKENREGRRISWEKYTEPLSKKDIKKEGWFLDRP